jgi:catechol 2,3-dioxygenase-like lactoylglutathione lyase family enzyme
MDVLGLVWVGTRTDRHAETTAFFRDVLGLPVSHTEPDFAVLDVPDGSTVEVFGPRSEFNRHFTHPVAGFRVADVAAAQAELEAVGVEVVLRPDGGERSWMHFRAPDGFVYELVQDDAR